jgi:FkbM family methyltransferase
MNTIKREQAIYNILQDDQSKYLFNNCCKIRDDLIENNCSSYDDLFDLQLQSKYEDFKYFIPIENAPITPISKIIEILKTHNTAIYGIGPGGIKFINLLMKLGIYYNIKALYDKNERKSGEFINGIEITTPPSKPETEFVIITMSNNKWILEAVNYCESIGFEKNKILILQYENEKVLYFDEDIIIPRLGNNEIFIDAGCYNFNTSIRFIEVAPNYKKIYAYEPDKDNYDLINKTVSDHNIKNVVLGQYAWWSADTTLSFKSDGGSSLINLENGDVIINTLRIDSVIPEDENVTYIKMDIEGAELEALKGAINTIKRCKPMLAIAIYHKAFDYLDLIEFCISLNPEYKVYIRQSFPYGTIGSTAYFV